MRANYAGAFRRSVLTAFAAICIAVGPSQAVDAQDLVVGVGGNITSIDPHYHNLAPNNGVATHIFDRLVHQDEQQRLIPGSRPSGGRSTTRPGNSSSART